MRFPLPAPYGDATWQITGIAPGRSGVLCYGLNIARPPGFGLAGLVDVVCDLPPATFEFVTMHARLGDRVLLSVATTGSSDLQYRWYAEENPTVTLGRSASVVIPIERDISVHVIVFNACASANFYVARVTIAADAPCVRPTVAIQPQSLRIPAGGKATLTFDAAGSSPLVVQWFMDDGRGMSVLDGQNGLQLTVTNVESTRLYWATVSNSCGIAETDHVLVEVPEPAKRRSARH